MTLLPGLEQYLLNYGVLGVWLLVTLWEKYTSQKNMSNILDDNTRALRDLRKELQFLRKEQKK